jgi:hypothetical protein
MLRLPQANYYQQVWDNTEGKEIDKALALFKVFSAYDQPQSETPDSPEVFMEKYKEKYAIREKIQIITFIRSVLDEYFIGKDGYLQYRNTLACTIEFFLLHLSMKQTAGLTHDSSVNSITFFAILDVIKKNTGIDAVLYFKDEFSWFNNADSVTGRYKKQNAFMLENCKKYNNWLEMIFCNRDNQDKMLRSDSPGDNTRILQVLLNTQRVHGEDLIRYLIIHEMIDSRFIWEECNPASNFPKEKLVELFELALKSKEYNIALYLFTRYHDFKLSHLRYMSKCDEKMIDSIIGLIDKPINNILVLKIMDHLYEHPSDDSHLATKIQRSFYLKYDLIENWEEVEAWFQEHLTPDPWFFLQMAIHSVSPKTISYLIQQYNLEINNISGIFWLNEEYETCGYNGSTPTNSQYFPSQSISISPVQYTILSFLGFNNNHLPPSKLLEFLKAFPKHWINADVKDSKGRSIGHYFDLYKKNKMENSYMQKPPEFYKDLNDVAEFLGLKSKCNFNKDLNLFAVGSKEEQPANDLPAKEIVRRKSNCG